MGIARALGYLKRIFPPSPGENPFEQPFELLPTIQPVQSVLGSSRLKQLQAVQVSKTQSGGVELTPALPAPAIGFLRCWTLLSCETTDTSNRAISIIVATGSLSFKIAASSSAGLVSAHQAIILYGPFYARNDMAIHGRANALTATHVITLTGLFVDVPEGELVEIPACSKGGA